MGKSKLVFIVAFIGSTLAFGATPVHKVQIKLIRSVRTRNAAEWVGFDSSGSQIGIWDTQGLSVWNYKSEKITRIVSGVQSLQSVSTLAAPKKFLVKVDGGKLFEISDGKVIRHLQFLRTDLLNVTEEFDVSPDERLAFLRTYQETIFVADFHTGDVLTQFAMDDRSVLQFKDRETFLAPEYSFGNIPKPKDKSNRIPLRSTLPWRFSSAYLPTQGMLFRAFYDGSVAAWCLPHPEPVFRNRLLHQTADALAPSPDGTLLAVGTRKWSHGYNLKAQKNQLMIIDARNGKKIQDVHFHTEGVYWLAFSPDGRYLAEADRRGLVNLFLVE